MTARQLPLAIDFASASYAEGITYVLDLSLCVITVYYQITLINEWSLNDANIHAEETLNSLGFILVNVIVMQKLLYSFPHMHGWSLYLEI